MTVQELSRYLTLRKQIDEDKEIYENMCQKMGPASPSLSGMPHTPGVRDKVGDLAADLADLDAGIKELEAEAERVLPAIEEFCVSISDPRDAPDFQAPFRAMPLMGRDRRNTRTVLYRSRSVQDGI